MMGPTSSSMQTPWSAFAGEGLSSELVAKGFGSSYSWPPGYPMEKFFASSAYFFELDWFLMILVLHSLTLTSMIAFCFSVRKLAASTMQHFPLCFERI